ncbi:barttin [Rhea pennata]|uniref:barttin n=1 Tax=Rhea pennata TaxID=8795 RepID=UPI002E25DCF4
MAGDEKTFRYAFIVLGFFLVMTGLFIMSVEKPQVYITFCTVGVLLVAVGVAWSMCQCYPRVTFVPADSETEQFLAPGPAAPPGEKPGKPRPQAPGADEKNLPTYEQVRGRPPARGQLHPEAPAAPRDPAAAGSGPAAPPAALPEEPGAQDDLYYGLQDGSDPLLAGSELLFEPED